MIFLRSVIKETWKRKAVLIKIQRWFLRRLLKCTQNFGSVMGRKKRQKPDPSGDVTTEMEGGRRNNILDLPQTQTHQSTKLLKCK